MNKKIKVIELIKQMEIKENLPKQIKYKNKVFDLSCSDDGMLYYANENWSMMSWIDSFYKLYEYVEILEDEEEIEEIKVDDNNYIVTDNGTNLKGRAIDITFVNKINEIIDKVNKLDKKINKED